MLRKLLLVGAATGLMVSGAQAADIEEAPVAFDWTGLYIGATAGYGWGDTEQFEGGYPSHKHSIDGFVAGGTLGYNWQIDNFLLGLEGDISYSDIHGKFHSNDQWGCGGGDPDECKTDVPWFGTLRARAGLPWDHFLPYITGGLAFGEIHSKIVDSGPDWNGDETVAGWTIGGGAEWAFDENWSAKIEYLWVDLDKADYGGSNDFKATADFSVVRGGINYRF